MLDLTRGPAYTAAVGYILYYSALPFNEVTVGALSPRSSSPTLMIRQPPARSSRDIGVHACGVGCTAAYCARTMRSHKSRTCFNSAAKLVSPRSHYYYMIIIIIIIVIILVNELLTKDTTAAIAVERDQCASAESANSWGKNEKRSKKKKMNINKKTIIPL